MPTKGQELRAMLRVAGVRVQEIADRLGVTSGYVQNQLSGAMTLQYAVERACREAIREKQEEWRPVSRGCPGDCGPLVFCLINTV